MKRQELQMRRARSEGTCSARFAARGVRSAGIGVCLLFGAAIVGVGCSGDNQATGMGGSGGTGTTGTGGTSGTGGSSGGGNSDGSVDCSLRKDVDTYSANMTKKGKNNIMSFLLLKSDPGPPIKGDNTWQLKVTGSDGMPVATGLKLKVWMPEHGHSSLKAPMIAYDAATGVYTLDPISLSIMPGVWQIEVTMNDNSDPPIPIDIGTFNFCVN